MAHPHQDLKHYHLFIHYKKNGRSYEIHELFRHSNKKRRLEAGTIQMAKDLIREKEGIAGPLYLTLHGVVLEPETLKLREIPGITLYGPNPNAMLVAHEGEPEEQAVRVVPESASDSD